MKQRRGKLFLFLLICSMLMLVSNAIICSYAAIDNNENEDLVHGKKLFFEARKIFYNAEAKSSEVEAVLELSKESFEKIKDEFTKNYWLSEVAYVFAEMNEESGQKRDAALKFNESSDLAKKALHLNQKSSDAHRVLANTYMRLMAYNGPLYSISKGSEAKKLLDKALQLDRDNYSAMNSMGMYLINAPRYAGGDLDKAMIILKKALASHEVYDQFIAFVWLGINYSKKKNKVEAQNYFNKALGIYPQSPWVKRLIEQIP